MASKKAPKPNPFAPKAPSMGKPGDNPKEERMEKMHGKKSGGKKGY